MNVIDSMNIRGTTVEILKGAIVMLKKMASNNELYGPNEQSFISAKALRIIHLLNHSGLTEIETNGFPNSAFDARQKDAGNKYIIAELELAGELIKSYSAGIRILRKGE